MAELGLTGSLIEMRPTLWKGGRKRPRAATPARKKAVKGGWRNEESKRKTKQ